MTENYLINQKRSDEMSITTIGIPSDDLECACLYLESGMRVLLREGYSIEDIEGLLSMILFDIFGVKNCNSKSENKVPTEKKAP